MAKTKATLAVYGVLHATDHFDMHTNEFYPQSYKLKIAWHRRVQLFGLCCSTSNELILSKFQC